MIEEEDEYFEIDQAYLEEHFGRPYFDIAIPIDELDDLVSDKNEIVVKNTYDDDDDGGGYRPTDYFIIRGTRITNRVIINELIRKEFNPNCNYRFLEGFRKCNMSSIEYECIMGS